MASTSSDSLGMVTHSLGDMAMIQIRNRTKDVLQQWEEQFNWLDEILEECKRSFARPDIELLPKTPSVKRGRKRIKKVDILDDCQESDFEVIPFKASKKVREDDGDADAEEEPTTPPRQTRKGRAASRNTTTATNAASQRNTRSQRNKGTKGPNSSSDPPVKNLSKVVGNLSKVPTPVFKTPNTAVRLKESRFATPKNSLNRSTFKTPVAQSKLVTPKPSTPSRNVKAIEGFNSMNVKEKASAYEVAALSGGSYNSPSKKNLAESYITETPPIDATPDTPSTLKSSHSEAKVSLSNEKLSDQTKRISHQLMKQNDTPKRSSCRSRASLRKSLKMLPTATKSKRSFTLHNGKRVTGESFNSSNSASEQIDHNAVVSEQKKTRTKLQLKKKTESKDSVSSAKHDEPEVNNISDGNDDIHMLSDTSVIEINSPVKNEGNSSHRSSSRVTRSSLTKTKLKTSQSTSSSTKNRLRSGGSVSSSVYTSSSASDSDFVDDHVKGERAQTQHAHSESEIVTEKYRYSTVRADSDSAIVTSNARSKESEESCKANPKRVTRSKIRTTKPRKNSMITSESEDEVFIIPQGAAPKSKKRPLENGESEVESPSNSKRCCTEGGSFSDKENSQPECSKDKDSSEESVMEEDSQSDSEMSVNNNSLRSFSMYNKDTNSLFTSLMKNKMNKSSTNLSSGVRSFIKRANSPRKVYTLKERQEMKKRELAEKDRKESERLHRWEEMQRQKREEQKKKRDEKAKRVAEQREQKEKQEREMKQRLTKKMEEKLHFTDKWKEEKLKEEREKQKLRHKKIQEVEEKRKHEEEERQRKFQEQEAEEKRRLDMLQRKKEFEELERARRIAEEKQRQEERLAEIEKEREAERLRLKQLEEEKERERLQQKEEREKQLAREKSERERIEIEKRRERDAQVKKQLDHLKELEKRRLAEQAAHEEKLKQQQSEIEKILENHKKGVLVNSLAVAPPKPVINMPSHTALNSSVEKPVNPDSYEMTPQRKIKPASVDNYDISDMRSDESTDDESQPRKTIPKWAQGSNLKMSLINQHYHPPDLDKLFSPIEPPDLNELFVKKRPRFNKRTSSAIWDSPLFKPHKQVL